ncbi:MAG: 50S ribosomal protein L18 [bacterium]
MAVKKRSEKRKIRQKRVRKKVRGTTERPRLCVYKSSSHIYAQLIDDSRGHTLCAAGTVSPELKEKLKSTKDIEAAKAVGELAARKAKQSGVTKVVFDRNGFLYHGRVKALADAARESGLEL